ncbi:MAG: hypothetical protein QOE70_1546 [Chthoniobacter sp.]|jgi:hypothetical protein|nr:hypothetical protein [Chthoniobacter sp.]
MNAKSTDQEQPIRFGGTELGGRRHICGFFRTPEEEYQLLLPFIREGIERGEKAFHVVDPKLRDDHLRRMESAGIDVAQAEKCGQFELCNWEQMYLRDGHFDQDRMLETWHDVLVSAGERGFARTRLVAHMEWALEDREGVSDLIEYEARFNLMHQGNRDPVICTYDLTRFSGDVIMGVLRTHPMVIIGGVLQENPFFIPPEQFLQELREHREREGLPTTVK